MKCKLVWLLIKINECTIVVVNTIQKIIFLYKKAIIIVKSEMCQEMKKFLGIQEVGNLLWVLDEVSVIMKKIARILKRKKFFNLKHTLDFC